MANYSSKTTSICCHVYRANRFIEWAENRFVDRLTIVGVPFGSLKAIEIKIMEISHEIDMAGIQPDSLNMCLRHKGRVRNVKFRPPRINYQTTHKC